MLLCNVKFSLLSFFPNMLHVSVYCLYLCLHLLLHLYLNWCVGIHYSTGRQASGRHLAHWLVCRSRAHQGASTVLHCTGRCTREETKEGAPGIHLGPDNSLRIGLLPAASPHIAWTFGFWVSVETSRELWSNFLAS